MLNDMIIDSAKELAEDNALQMHMFDVDIIHRVSQMVHEHLTENDRYGMLAVGTYRYYETQVRKSDRRIAQLEAALVS